MARAHFADRVDAGRQLGAALRHLAAATDGPRPLVLGLPRGGVVVAAEVATALDADLDALVVAKVRLPSQPELALGAYAAGGVQVTNARVVERLRPSADALEAAWREAVAAVEGRDRDLRRGRPPPEAALRTVIVVDDGLATGATARAALQAVRAMGAAVTVLALPVAPRRTADDLRGLADEVVVLWAPERFGAVSVAYDDFAQTTDTQVRQLLGLGGPG